MERAGLFLCCFCAGLAGVLGQVGSLCRPNERFLSCGGCQKTCEDPAPACAAVCRTGCYCDLDQVRNRSGHCIPLSECPRPSEYRLDTSEPRPECPPNQEYRFCELCNRTCDNPNPICPAQCNRGCFCRDDLLRDSNGSCVEYAKCSKSMKNESFNLIVSIPLTSVCGPGQVFKECEPCEKSCHNPNPVCPAQCSRGCFCEVGLLRAPSGHCVKPERCPIDNSIVPMPLKVTCGPGQVFKECEPCEKSCHNPNPVCPAQCSRGCFCEVGLLRAPSGHCVKPERCPIANSIVPMPLKVTCGPGQVFKTCEPCEKSCHNPNPVCPAQCSRGCFCEVGLLRAPSGQCVKPESCPKAEVSYGAVDPTIEDCAPDEEFLACGWCEPSCWEPAPACPHVCTRGCLCRPPLLRHHSGLCVERAKCEPQKCLSPNEEFVCRYGCESVCGAARCTERPRRCQLGCHCRLGLLRDPKSGRCLTPDECVKQRTTLSPNSWKSVAFSDDMNTLARIKLLIARSRDGAY